MKKTLKLFGSLIMTLALVFAMALTSGAADDADMIANVNISPITLHISNVADGDTITAYRLVKYDANYNAYQFDSKFEAYLRSIAGTEGNGKTAEEIFNSSRSDLAVLLGDYAANSELPSAQGEVVNATVSSNGADLELNPGYYLILGKTATSNIYRPMSVFVQVKNGACVVYGGGEKDALSKDGQGKYNIAAKKSDGPTIDKLVYDERETNWNTAASAAIGDTVDFYVAVTIPSYTGVTNVNLNLKDTLTNLEYVAGSVAVYSAAPNGKTFNTDALITDAISAEGTTIGSYDTEKKQQELNFKLNYANVKDYTTVYVSYKATVKSDAVTTMKGENSAKLVYSTSADSSWRHTEDKKTDVFTYAFGLNKTDKDGERLKGAGFTIYPSKDCDDATALEFVKEEAYYRPATENEEGAVTELEADFVIKGMNLGTYYVKETTVPTGYYAPKGAFELELDGNRADANILNGKLNPSSHFVTALDGTAAEKNAENTLITAAKINDVNNWEYDVTMKNSDTPILPSTGGAGTVLFTIVGVALMVLAVWLFFFRGKKTAK